MLCSIRMQVIVQAKWQLAADSGGLRQLTHLPGRWWQHSVKSIAGSHGTKLGVWLT